ncbi:AMP deaminase Amd1, partial [Reticulomyxa filosa]
DAPRVEACRRIDRCRQLRLKYVYKQDQFSFGQPGWYNCAFFLTVCKKKKKGFFFFKQKKSDQLSRDFGLSPKSLSNKWTVMFEHGTAHLVDVETKQVNALLEDIPSCADFLSDLDQVMELTTFGPAKTLCYRRLQMLEARFELHLQLNDETELKESRQVPYRDFYNVRKVDNHIHHSACMHQKHLLSFMQSKLKKEPNAIVQKDEKGKEMTLKEVFDKIGIGPNELSITLLDVLSCHICTYIYKKIYTYTYLY